MHERTPTAESDRGYEGWRVVAACGMGAFFATVPLNTFPIFLKPLCDHFSWSRESASSAFGTLTLVAALSAPWIGGLLDRVGARRVIVPCLALSGIAVAALASLTALWQLRAIFAVVGLAMMGASPIAYSRAIFGWFDARRGQALGIMLTGAALSAIVLPPAAERLIRVSGWRTAWLVLGLCTLAIGFPTAWRFIRDRAALGSRGDAGATGVTVAQALRSRVFWTLVLVVFGGTMATSGAIVHVIALLTDRGVRASRGALAISAMGSASLLGRLLTGWLLDRLPAPGLAALLLAVAASGAFVLAGAHSFGSAVLAAICIGFGSGGEVDVVPFLVSRHFGLRSLSTLYGFNWTAWGLASAAGPIVMGRAFDATGSYSSALMELGVLSFLAAGLILTLPALPRAAARGATS